MPEIRNLSTSINSFANNAKQAIDKQSIGDYYNSVQPDDWGPTAATTGRYSRHPRTPWVVTCKSWLSQGKGINLYVNPKDTAWSIGRRGTSVKTAAGTVRNVWRNRYKGTYFDEPEIRITFQSGSVMPFMSHINTLYDLGGTGKLGGYLSVNEALTKGGIPPGLRDFYWFLNLLDQPAWLGPGENNHIITYHSRVFPTMFLEGFFKDEEPIAFTESAQGGDNTGNTINWTATFVVYRSYPPLNNAQQLISTYEAWVAGDGASEAIPLPSLSVPPAKVAAAAVAEGLGGGSNLGGSVLSASEFVQAQIAAAKARGTTSDGGFVSSVLDQTRAAANGQKGDLAAPTQDFDSRPNARPLDQVYAELLQGESRPEPGTTPGPTLPPAPPSRGEQAGAEVSATTQAMLGGGPP
jgi:hypothetical protein